MFKVGSLRRVIWAKYAAGLANIVTYAAEDFFPFGENILYDKGKFSGSFSRSRTDREERESRAKKAKSYLSHQTKNKHIN